MHIRNQVLGTILTPFLEIFWLEIRANSKGGVGALKLRNCHRANVAEPNLWDLWALQMGPVAAHILIIHSVKEMGGNVQQKRVLGIHCKIGKGVKMKREIYPKLIKT